MFEIFVREDVSIVINLDDLDDIEVRCTGETYKDGECVCCGSDQLHLTGLGPSPEEARADLAKKIASRIRFVHKKWNPDTVRAMFKPEDWKFQEAGTKEEAVSIIENL